MKKYAVLCCLLVSTLSGNFIVVNRSGGDVIIKERWPINKGRNNKDQYYKIAPNEKKEIEPNKDISYLEIAYASDISTFRYSEGRIEMLSKPDSEYRSILVKAREYMPVITISNNPKTNTPVTDMPQSTKELQERIAQAKAAITKEVSRVTELPSETGAIAGIITEFNVDE